MTRGRRIGFAKLVIASLVASGSAFGQGICSPGWSAPFPVPGVNQFVFASTTFDDGTGPTVYLGGQFQVAGAVLAQYVVKWTGISFVPLGAGVPYPVSALASHDDGTGPALYAAFSGVATTPFPYSIAKWNGATWIPVPGSNFPQITSLVSFDDGTGAKLYAGGYVTNTPGAFGGVAAWNGTTWINSVGGGVTGGSGLNGPVVNALEVFTSGGQSRLFAAGNFAFAGATSVANIASWNGTSWASPGSGIPMASSSVLIDMQVHDDGSGSALYVTGGFTAAGGVAANGIARWNGAAWSAAGAGLNPSGAAVLASFDDGSGSKLYAGAGVATLNNGAGGDHLVRWNGSTWTSPGGVQFHVGPLAWQVLALAGLPGPSGPQLIIGGTFERIGASTPSTYVAQWTGSAYLPLSSGFNGPVHALCVYNSGSGPELYAGGSFTQAGTAAANSLAKWNGTTWTQVGSGLSTGVVRTMCVFNDGTGSKLYIGGALGPLAPNGSANVVRWDGSFFLSVGAGFDQQVLTLAVHNFGTGPSLYAGGTFNNSFAAATNKVARWNGVSWQPLGVGLSGEVDALISHDDGSGPALYAGGVFLNSGTTPVNKLARWNGTTWSSVGGGLASAAAAMLVFNDGTGSALYTADRQNAGGGFGVRKWNGTNWSLVGPLMGTSTFNLNCLAAFDDGSGSSLFVGGHFMVAGGVPVYRVARFNGVTWVPLGAGVDSQSISHVRSVNSLLPFDDGTGSALWVGGDFTAAGGIGAGSLARWRATPQASLSLTLAQSFGSGSLIISVNGGTPSGNVFTAFTFDPANITSPGTGWWCGLHILPQDVVNEILFFAPPFVMGLNAGGGAGFSIPQGTLNAVIGQTLSGVSLAYDAPTLLVTGSSPVTSLVLQ